MRDDTNEPKLTPKEALIVKTKVNATLQGKSQRAIARDLYPNSSQAAAEVEVSKNLNKPNVQAALQIALAKHNLTADRVAKVVDEAMGANKTITIGKDGDSFIDEVADHSIRLKAAGMAAQFMGINKEDNVPQSVHFHNHQAKENQEYDL